jgi:ketosteroid isomerase-like protein
MEQEERMADDRLQAMLDREEIRSALIRYTRGVDRLDAELIADLYHDDAIDHHGPFDMRGKEFAAMVVDYLRQNTPGGHQHRICNISIEFDGDTAWTEAVLHSIHNNISAINEFFGRYVDRFEKRAGVWKVAERWVVCDFTRATPLTEHYAVGDDFIKGTRDKTDPSWQR